MCTCTRLQAAERTSTHVQKPAAADDEDMDPTVCKSMSHF